MPQGEYIVVDRPGIKIWFTYSNPAAPTKGAVKKPKKQKRTQSEKAKERRLL